MGLETWTGEEELGADEEEQPGAEEVTLERKKQLEAVCPLLLRGRRGADGANSGGSHTSKAGVRHEVRGSDLTHTL